MILHLALALLFYAALPLFGAFQVRRRWRRLRQRVTSAAASEDLTFSLLQTPGRHRGPYRLLGSLEAIEGRDTLWIGGESVSVPVYLRGIEVYFVEDNDDSVDSFAPKEPPRRVPWNALGVLPEGTHFFIWGWLGEGTAIDRFEAAPDRPLLVMAYSGDSRTVLERVIRDGRQPIEHWNPWTPVSLVVGFGTLLLAGYWQLHLPGLRETAQFGLALALLPSTFFLPPGIVMFYLFAKFWATSRAYRAQRDLVVFRSGAPNQQSRALASSARQLEIFAHALLLLGVGLNALLLFLVLRLLAP